MTDPSAISDAEAKVMEVLWDESPLTAQGVISRLASTAWTAQTIKTLLGRLLKKGALSYEKDGRRFLYSPVLTREHYIEAQSTSLVQRLFGGRVTAMVAAFADQGMLSDDDLDALKKLVARLDNADEGSKDS